MSSVGADFGIWFMTVATGAMIGLVYDLWLVAVVEIGPAAGRPRRRGRISAAVLAAFWIIAIGIAWLSLMLFAGGAVRGALLAGFGAGAVLYHVTVSGLIRRFLRGLRRLVLRFVRTLLDMLTWLVLLPGRIVWAVLGPVVRFLTAVLAAPARLILGLCEGFLRGCGRLVRLLTIPRRPRTKPPPA